MKCQTAALLLTVGIISAVGVGYREHVASAQTESPVTSSMEIKGLQARVTITRDERGIPYIQANNDHDLYFAQGYATAEDRLWQMELLRRTARGELAEVLGAGPNNVVLEQDKLHRTYGFAQAADAELALATPQARAVLEAYAEGVNAYTSSLEGKKLPPEFQVLGFKPRPWSDSDSLAIVKLFFEALSSTWRLDVMREALTALPPEKRAVLLPERSSLDVLVVGKDGGESASSIKRQSKDPAIVSLASLADQLCKVQEIEETSLARVGLFSENLAASNNWVVSGKLTASGKPLLANDPHLAPSAPSIWYMVHLSAPGVRVAGVNGVGLPGVVIGHNDRIAWGFTNVGPDVQDVYVENFDPAHPLRYQTPSGWRDAAVRHEEIKVRKGFADTTTTVTTLDVTVTRHGPIILEQSGKRYALRWTAIDPKLNNSDVTFQLNRAKNWKEFTAALRSFTAPTQNIVYADVDGHIGYHAGGLVPIRKSGDGSVPYDGSKNDGEWTSFIPSDKLPQVLDPPSGIIVTANQRIVGESYPYFLTHSWAQPYRARRILDLLREHTSKGKITADDIRAIQGDLYSISGALFAKQAAAIMKGRTDSPDDASLRQTLDEFEKWDGRIAADSLAAAKVVQMRTAFRNRILNAALGQELFKIFAWSNFDSTLDRVISERPPDWLPKEFQTYADLIRACHQEAVQNLKKGLGDDQSQWTWGNLVKARFPHPLASAPLVGAQFIIQPFPQNGTGGTAATVNVGAAVSMRLIADPADWDRTQQGIALGESGIPSNPHWKDQLDDWRKVTPREFPFSEAAVAKAAKTSITLMPAK